MAAEMDRASANSPNSCHKFILSTTAYVSVWMPVAGLLAELVRQQEQAQGAVS